jgi:hypothetical protein
LKFNKTYSLYFWTSEESQLVYKRYFEFPGDWENINLKNNGFVKSLERD